MVGAVVGWGLFGDHPPPVPPPPQTYAVGAGVGVNGQSSSSADVVLHARASTCRSKARVAKVPTEQRGDPRFDAAATAGAATTNMAAGAIAVFYGRVLEVHLSGQGPRKGTLGHGVMKTFLFTLLFGIGQTVPLGEWLPSPVHHAATAGRAGSQLSGRRRRRRRRRRR